MKTKLMKSIGVLMAVLVVVLIASSTYQALASKADLAKYPPPGQMVDVGGHRLHINCLGQGSPTVVLEAGISGWSSEWSAVQDEIAKTTRVCAYDRAGHGWSESGPQPRDARQVAKELHTLLDDAGIDGEIILVGHSMGGLYAQYYARQYPQQVAGLVLEDAVHFEQSKRMEEDVRKKYEGGLTSITTFSKIMAPTGLLRLAGQSETIIAYKLPPELKAMVKSIGMQTKAYSAMADEMTSFQRSQTETQELGPLPSIPMAVISSTLVKDFPPGFSEAVKKSWDQLQADLSLSATIPHVIAEKSGHYIHLDQPDLVSQTILQMIENVRGK